MILKNIERTTWNGLIPLWQGGKEIVQHGLPHTQLSSTWQMLLLGDGSLTRNLQLLSGEHVKVDLIDMSEIGMDFDGAPDEVCLISGPRLRRQVWLCNSSGQRLAYATSWWNADHANEYLQNREIPIWTSLSSQRTELYRDIWGIHYGRSAFLESAFCQAGPFWGRYYLFWHQGQPLTLIYEVFSPYLRKYLGLESLVDELAMQVIAIPINCPREAIALAG